MSTFLRDNLNLGPGSLVFGNAPGLVIYDSTGINLDTDLATKDLPSSLLGKAATLQTDRVAKVSATPVGELSQALLDLFFPWRNLLLATGKPIHTPGVDVPLVIHAMSGKRVKLLNAVLVKPPEMILSTVETSFGRLEFDAITPGDKTSTDPLYALDDLAYDLGAHDTPLSGVAYTAKCGALLINSTVNGFRVSVEPQLTAVQTDEAGTLTWFVSGVNVTARCTPTQLSELDILAALDINRGRGRPIGGADPLVISGPGGLEVTLNRASLRKGPLKWGNTELRAGELEFTANAKPDGSLYDVKLLPAS